MVILWSIGHFKLAKDFGKFIEFKLLDSSNTVVDFDKTFLIPIYRYLRRKRPAKSVGGADQPAVRPHAAPGEGAGPGQTVCRDPPLHAQLRRAEGRNTETFLSVRGQKKQKKQPRK